MRSIEARIAKLEEQSVAVERRIHVVFVPDCRIDDEPHNAVQKKKALGASPVPEGAQVLLVMFVSGDRESQMVEPARVESAPERPKATGPERDKPLPIPQVGIV